jgi:hypothetical protein
MLSLLSFTGPASVASAIVVALSAFTAVTPLLGPGVGSFVYEGLMNVLGLLPKRKQVWGTVYDANTKRPIPFARVQLLDAHKRVLETRIADEGGRYGFLSTPESLLAQNVQISIVVTHKGHVFPSHTPASLDTLIYNNLYYGKEIVVNDATLINFDIPMDPARPSKAPIALASPSIMLGAAVAAMADAGFWLGLIMVPLNFIMTPNPFTFGIVCLYLGTASLRLFGITEHPYGVVVDAQTGRAVPFALLTLNDMTGKRAAFAVSDERGRYFLVLSEGEYEISVFTPSGIVPPRQVKKMIRAKRGWITEEIKL